MKNRKKYWKESVIWGKTIPNKEYNVETQKEEPVRLNCLSERNACIIELTILFLFVCT